MQAPAGLMCYHANACGLDVLSCKRLWAGCVIMETPVGWMCNHANVCGLDVGFMQTPVGLMCYHANACGLDVLSCKHLWA